MSRRICGAVGVTALGIVLGSVHGGRAATIPPRELSPYQVIRAQSALVRHGDRQQLVASSLYDGTGLTHENPLLAQHGSDPDTIWRYPITPNEYPVSVEFDLVREYLVNEMWVWQLQGRDLESQGLLEFDIVMRDAARRQVGVLEGALDEFKRVGIQPVQRFNAFGECVFLPVPDCVRYVELRIRRNRGDSQWLALAEVAFAGWKKNVPVPEPASSLSLIAAGLGLWNRSRRARPAPRRLTTRPERQRREAGCSRCGERGRIGLMKGPYQRLKYDLRRVWECPVCHHRERTGGNRTTFLCRCQRKTKPAECAWMKLIEDGVRRADGAESE